MIRAEIIEETEDLRLSYAPGDAPRRLVVVFAGLNQNLGGVADQEFSGSGSGAGRDAVLFVADKQRHWYAAPDVGARIVETVKRIAADLGVKDITALGNSMGGFGAILLAPRFDARAVLAFAPQISMDPSVVADKRWTKFQPLPDGPRPLSLDQAVAAAPKIRFAAIFGGSLLERRQARLLATRPNAACYLLADASHNVASRIKKAGQLSPLIASHFQRDAAGADAALKAAGAARMITDNTAHRLRRLAARLPHPHLRQVLGEKLDAWIEAGERPSRLAVESTV